MKFYEKGERPLEILTTRQWFIRTTDFADELLARGPRAALASRRTCDAATRTGSRGLTGDWCISRQRVFGVPIPRLVPARRRRPARPRAPDRARRPLRSTPRARRRRATTADQRDQPGRVHGRPGRDGHVGDVVAQPAHRGRRRRRPRPLRAACTRWTCARRRTRSSAPGCSPRSCARTSSTGSSLSPRRDLGLGPRPRAQEDVQVQGQRVTPQHLIESLRRRRRALLGGQGAPGHRHRLRRAPDEGRPAAGGQAAQRLAARARRSGRAGRRAPPTEPVDRAHARRAGRRRRPRPRAASSDYDHARALDAPSAASGRSATTTSSSSRAARYGDLGPEAAALGAGRAARCALDLPAPARPVPALRDRGDVVVVAGRLRSTARRGRSRGSAHRRRPGPAARRHRRARRRAQGQVRRAPQAARTRRARAARPTRPSGSRPWRAADDLRAAGAIEELELAAGDGFALRSTSPTIRSDRPSLSESGFRGAALRSCRWWCPDLPVQPGSLHLDHLLDSLTALQAGVDRLRAETLALGESGGLVASCSTSSTRRASA